MRAQFHALCSSCGSCLNVRRRTGAHLQLEGFKQVHSGLHARYVLDAGQIQHFFRGIDLGQPGAGIHHRLQRRRQLEFSAFRMRRQCGQMRLRGARRRAGNNSWKRERSRLQPSVQRLTLLASL